MQEIFKILLGIIEKYFPLLIAERYGEMRNEKSKQEEKSRKERRARIIQDRLRYDRAYRDGVRSRYHR